MPRAVPRQDDAETDQSELRSVEVDPDEDGCPDAPHGNGAVPPHRPVGGVPHDGPHHDGLRPVGPVRPDIVPQDIRGNRLGPDTGDVLLAPTQYTYCDVPTVTGLAPVSDSPLNSDKPPGGGETAGRGLDHV
ncbi:hypothetical protein ACWD6R_35770 [Streptomyces sp. NPDC005151]